MSKAKEVVASVKKGNESKNPVATKQKQLGANVAAALTGVVCFYIKKHHPDFPIFEYQDLLTTMFLSLVGLINCYFTAASSKKIGLLG